MNHKEDLKKAFLQGKILNANFDEWYEDNFYVYELKGTYISGHSYTHSNRNHLVIEILGEENYIGNNIKIGDKLKITKATE